MREFDVAQMIIRIKQLKKQKGLSNEALSDLSGVPKSTLAKIFGSETKDPQISNIIKIIKVLDTTADFLLFGKSENETKGEFSERDKKLVRAYHSHPDVQFVIDKLLEIDIN